MGLFAFYIRHRGALRTGLKLIAAIVGLEMLIMLGIELSGFEHDSLWVGVGDALLLGVLSSVLIYFWVVKPLKAANHQAQLFNAVVNNLSVGIIVTEASPGNSDGLNEQRIIAINPAFTHITGYSAEEAIGRHPRLLQDENADKDELEKMRQAIRENRSVNVLQRNRRKDGTLFWNNLHLSPLLNHKGRAVQWVGLVEDVSEQKKLEERAAHLAQAVQQADEAMCMFSPDGRLLAMNPAYCRNVRCSEEDLIGQSMWQYWDSEEEKTTAMAMTAVREHKSWSGKHLRRRSDGTCYNALTSISPVQVKHGDIYFSALHRDISDLTEIEGQLIQAQKMEAVGTLAGGIAHDFNNLLAGILGNLYLVQRDMQDHPKALKRLRRVEKQGYQAADVIRQLLTFAHAGVMKKKNFDIQPFFKEMIKFARPGIPENIDIITEIAEEKMLVSGDPGRLQQAVLNLITNARHAIEQRLSKSDTVKNSGRITLRAGMVCGKEKECRGECYLRGQVGSNPDACVCIEIEDNGIGMDKETLKRIFEPYFTTKEVGRGTGLGLPMVKGCVEMQGGCINVESTPGKGSSFRIWLPLIGETSHIDVANETHSELVRGNGELILIADDNAEARQTLKDMLERSGFEVIVAEDGEEARQMFFAFNKRLNAVFLDIVMPRCNGTVVAQEISEARPDMPLALMTGYDIEDTLSNKEFIAQGKIDVLNKPWKLMQINHVLQKVVQQEVTDSA
ncbi:MAG: PAS domain S-box protein [Mariprofundaceae bacterium]|nr:PAS domain S-box protein [Mariprofundaceae bacterium]